jgi:F0F1-type ATP synthase gamma subunit
MVTTKTFCVLSFIFWINHSISSSFLFHRQYGDGCSKLTQIIKESVKAVLAKNKQVISVSFAALIQTLKNDPEMIKLIHHLPALTDSEHKDNNTNASKHFEFNKDSILDLAEEL